MFGVPGEGHGIVPFGVPGTGCAPPLDPVGRGRVGRDSTAQKRLPGKRGVGGCPVPTSSPGRRDLGLLWVPYECPRACVLFRSMQGGACVVGVSRTGPPLPPFSLSLSGH